MGVFVGSAYGRRGVSQVALSARGSTTTTPRWVQVLGIHAIGLALLFVISMHITRGGVRHH